METLEITPSEMALVRELESDLASVAVNAATELDNFALGRSERLDEVQRLAERLSESFEGIEQPSSPQSLIDPTEVVVMHRAIQDSALHSKMTTVDELVREAGKVVERLNRIVKDPEVAGTDVQEVKQIRDFCLALSKAASAYDHSLDDMEFPHPFRR
jgi:hypothetical protein